MTSASRAFRAVGLAVVAGLAASALVGCAASAPPSASPRTAPNDAEVTAVARASGFADVGMTGRIELGAPWVQLWTQRQVPEAVADCLRGTLTVDECFAAHPVDLRVFAMSESERSALYGYYLTFLDRCLVSQGFPVGRIPDRERFLIQVRDGDPWSPYDRVQVPSRASWYALSDACPPVPAVIDAALQPR